TRNWSAFLLAVRFGCLLPEIHRRMKTILVLTSNPEFAETLRAGLNPEQFRVVHRVTLEESEPLLAHGLVQGCVLDLEMTGVRGVWVLEKIRRLDPKCPLVVFTESKQPEWEEEAYLQGVAHVLAKPVRPRLLAALLDRLPASPRPAPAPAPAQPAAPTPTYSSEAASGTLQTAD